MNKLLIILTMFLPLEGIAQLNSDNAPNHLIFPKKKQVPLRNLKEEQFEIYGLDKNRTSGIYPFFLIVKTGTQEFPQFYVVKKTLDYTGNLLSVEPYTDYPSYFTLEAALNSLKNNLDKSFQENTPVLYNQDFPDDYYDFLGIIMNIPFTKKQAFSPEESEQIFLFMKKYFSQSPIIKKNDQNSKP